jgi:hypothetical protein
MGEESDEEHQQLPVDQTQHPVRESEQDQPGRRQPESDRHDGQTQIAAEIQRQPLADQHVLRIADQSRRRAEIGGTGEREQKGRRIEPARAAGRVGFRWLGLGGRERDQSRRGAG